jgi:hypothetical protein
MKTSGLDVHKDTIFCAIYDGQSYSAVKEFSTTSVSIRSLGEHLKSEKVKSVAIGEHRHVLGSHLGRAVRNGVFLEACQPAARNYFCKLFRSFISFIVPPAHYVPTIVSQNQAF